LSVMETFVAPAADTARLSLASLGTIKTEGDQ